AMSFAVSDGALAKLGKRIRTASAGAVTGCTVAHGELNLETQAGRIAEVLTRLRDDPACPFEQLIDLTACDYPQRAQRFDVVYHLLSLTGNRRVRVKVR